MIYRNLKGGRMDELYLGSGNILYNTEEESGRITQKTLDKYKKYAIFVVYWYYPIQYHLVVICHIDPGKKTETIIAGPSVHIIVHYIYFSTKELLDRYENLINKVDAYIELDDNEALDIVHIPKFIDKKYKVPVLEEITKRWKKIIIKDKTLKLDVKILLKAMIEKHVPDRKTQKKFKGRMNMETYKDEIYELARDMCADEINELEKKNTKNLEEITGLKKEKEKDREEITGLKKENAENLEKITGLKKEKEKDREKINELLKLKDLNTPKAKQILSSLMVMK